ncbi:hypothetical protein PENTCL1PPCAC_2679 [Pristionchus entomophagus]|uniref:Uncharacterized protein n=1 Tax=Pristionchus entomophagus TaxID=358040 RepID=A0AAV5SGG7_9BILA|nr:hypothetical protein PENTCL1PPCAC_2679 [Pristionchus entomophagus]
MLFTCSICIRDELAFPLNLLSPLSPPPSLLMFSFISIGLLPFRVPSVATILAILIVGVHSASPSPSPDKECNKETLTTDGGVKTLLKPDNPNPLGRHSTNALSYKYPNRCPEGEELTLTTKKYGVFKLDYIQCKKGEWVMKMRMTDDMYEHKPFQQISKYFNEKIGNYDNYLSCEKKEVMTFGEELSKINGTLKSKHEEYLKEEKNVQVLAIIVALIPAVLLISLQLYVLHGCGWMKRKLMKKKKQAVEAENQNQVVRDSKKDTVAEPVDIDKVGETMVG